MTYIRYAQATSFCKSVKQIPHIHFQGSSCMLLLEETLNEDTDILILDNVDDIGLGLYDPSHKLINAYRLPETTFQANSLSTDERYSYILKTPYLFEHPQLYKIETGTVLGAVKECISGDHYLIYKNLFSYSKLQGNLIVKGSDELLNIIRQIWIYIIMNTLKRPFPIGVNYPASSTIHFLPICCFPMYLFSLVSAISFTIPLHVRKENIL